MERHGEVFVLIGGVVNTFIPRLPFVPCQCPFIPIFMPLNLYAEQLLAFVENFDVFCLYCHSCFICGKIIIFLSYLQRNLRKCAKRIAMLPCYPLPAEFFYGLGCWGVTLLPVASMSISCACARYFITYPS